MARGTQLQALVSKLRAEIGQSTNTSLGLTELGELQQLIRRHQETLYYKHDWPHLRVRRDKTLNAGQRYYDWPTDLSLERTQPRAFVFWGSQWVPLEFGIDRTLDYNAFDSDAGARSDPVLKWDIYSATQFEVWPIPATAGTIRFTGTKALSPLIADSDTADLDDILITLFAAAEKRSGKPDGKAKATLAQDHYARLTGLQAKAENFRFGQTTDDTPTWRGTVIHVSSGP